MTKAPRSSVVLASALATLVTISCVDSGRFHGPNDDENVIGQHVEVYVGEEATMRAMADIAGILNDRRLLVMSARMNSRNVEEWQELLESRLDDLGRYPENAGAASAAQADPTITYSWTSVHPTGDVCALTDASEVTTIRASVFVQTGGQWDEYPDYSDGFTVDRTRFTDEMYVCTYVSVSHDDVFIYGETAHILEAPNPDYVEWTTDVFER